MRCDEVTRELAAPTGEGDAAALAQHLASCPSCQSWADASARLDQLWSATRPPEPTTAHWEQVWSAVTAGPAAPLEPVTLRLAPLAAVEAAGTLSAPLRPRRRWLVPAVAAAFVAQAAMVSLATWVLFRPAPSTTIAPSPAVLTAASPASTPSQMVEFELEEGQTLFLVLDEQGGKVVCRPQFLATADLVAFDSESPDPYALAFQSDLEMLNAMESLE